MLVVKRLMVVGLRAQVPRVTVDPDAVVVLMSERPVCGMAGLLEAFALRTMLASAALAASTVTS
jgi:hypothetical protein